MRFDDFNDADAEHGTWTRERLEQMNASFVAV